MRRSPLPCSAVHVSATWLDTDMAAGSSSAARAAETPDEHLSCCARSKLNCWAHDAVWLKAAVKGIGRTHANAAA